MLSADSDEELVVSPKENCGNTLLDLMTSYRPYFGST